MFLFLSKLLPLFLYPLGLSSLLLLGALITVWKRPQLCAFLIALALAVILISGNGWIASRMVQSLEWQNLPQKELPTADAIVVLGGATRPQKYPRPWVDLAEEGDRIIHGVRLFQQKKAPLLIVSGGRIDWKANSADAESADLAKIAKSFGVPDAAIVQDPTSLNTYENAVNVKKILQQRGINRVLLVTSAMHMPRSIAIFRKQGINATPAPTDFLISEEELRESADTLQEKTLNLFPDAIAIHRFARSMKEYIGLGVYRLQGWL